MSKTSARAITKTVCLAAALLLSVASAVAQVYHNGRGPMQPWRQIKSPDYKLVYPVHFESTAIKMSGFLDSIAPHINKGFTRTPQRIPIVLRTHSQYSNGEVVWAPKRMELITTPPVSTYADPWLKQLSVHESRHTAQISALRGGLTKVASVLFGEAGMGLGLLCVPTWYLEGDATMAETQFSEFGRGMQPSMSVDLRAMLMDSTRLNASSDEWECGSFRQYTPSVYTLGYQMVAAGERRYGTSFWEPAVEYAGKYPILFVPMRVYLKREAGVQITPMINSVMDELREWWRPHSAVPNNYDIVGRYNRSHVTYGPPVISPSGAVIVTRSDFDTPVEWVALDSTTHSERHLAWGTTPSSRPIIRGNKLYWTEYKPHPIWEYKSSSIVREIDITTKQRKSYGRGRSSYFVTPLGDNQIAVVSPDSLGGHDIVLYNNDFKETDRMCMPHQASVHGMAWDSLTNTLAVIVLDNRGMWLGATTPCGDSIGTLRPLTDPSMVSISGLSASQGQLYYSSIASGKDEIHTFSLHDGIERRLTTSTLGAYMPAVRDSTLIFNSYTTRGMMLGERTTSHVGADTVHWSRLPRNTLNIPNAKWDVPKMSTIAMTDTVTSHRKRRYNSALRWFNVHSWAPIAVDIEKLINERTFNIGFGASVLFQSVLGDSYGSATYGWLNKSNWLTGSFVYAGLPVHIGIDAEYGGGKQSVYIPVDNSAEAMQRLDGRDNYTGVSLNLSLPLNFSGGSNLRLLQPSFSMTHYNALLYNPSTTGFDRGYQKYNLSLWWSSNRRSSLRSVVPRLGYALRTDISGAFGNRFGIVYSFYARGYLPGIGRNHSITLRTGMMYQTLSELNFNQKPLTPRGTDNSFGSQRYAAHSMDYTMPLFYPDWGVNGLIYFKRIWVNFFGDYSVGDYFAPQASTRTFRKYSYGGDIALDVNFLSSRSPITLKFTIAAPSDNRFYFGFGFSLNL